MGWRTQWCGCGGGVGCSHEQPTPLCVVQGEPIRLSLFAPVAVAGELVRCEARVAPLGRLLLDMTPFCYAVSGDPAVLLVDVPGEVTAEVFSSGVWDAWVGEDRIAHGPFLVEFGVSRRPGRTAIVADWSPTFREGYPFSRNVSLDGIMPADEYLGSGEGDVAPELVVFGLDGAPAQVWKGNPQVTVSTDPDMVHVALSEEDTTDLGVGRFTYSLVVFNDVGERRVVLAGVLTVVEGGGRGAEAPSR